MSQPWVSRDVAMAEMLREDPAFAAAYLDAVLADGDQAEILIALRHIVNARGGMQQVAERTELNPTTLYRTLSPTGNPELRSLMKVLHAVGLRLSIAEVRA